MKSFKIDYKSNKCELCELGHKYITDKTSIAPDDRLFRHTHAYTLFYDEHFRNKKDESLNFLELGISYGASLRMWQEYLTKSTIYAGEISDEGIDHFKNNFNTDRIIIEKMDTRNKNDTINTLNRLNVTYDVIIDDTNHDFDNQIGIIETFRHYLKPGGLLIIEDIFENRNEKDYYDKLKPILDVFQDYYFIEIDHVNRCSIGWDNNKILVLVKGGAEPIFTWNNYYH